MTPGDPMPGPEDNPADEISAEEYFRGMEEARERQVWQCKVCRRKAPRSEWGSHRGLLCCSTCLVSACVDTLELVE